eukprot:3339512-Pyramimonas_sp.AAC.1
MDRQGLCESCILRLQGARPQRELHFTFPQQCLHFRALTSVTKELGGYAEVSPRSRSRVGVHMASRSGFYG